MDLIQQLINTATTTAEFAAAAALLRNHIATNRDPLMNQPMLVSLSLRGHYLVSQGCNGQSIAEQVLRTLNTEPRHERTMVA